MQSNDYYTLFDITPSFIVNVKSLKTKYYALSRQFHPDQHVDDEQMYNVLEQSAKVNDAWKMFQSPMDTLAYFLKYKGVLDADEQYNLSSDFLMDMMDLNETLSDVLMDPDPEALALVHTSVNTLLLDLDAQLVQIHKPDDEYSSNELMELKEIFYRKKYILRIQERINNFATS